MGGLSMHMLLMRYSSGAECLTFERKKRNKRHGRNRSMCLRQRSEEKQDHPQDG